MAVIDDALVLVTVAGCGAAGAGLPVSHLDLFADQPDHLGRETLLARP